MRIIKTADWHLTDSKSDSYKWEFFSWLKEQVIKKRVERVDFLGDLTEKKDRHCSDLLNKATDVIVDLSELCEVVFLKGNHDYIEQSSPFFQFLKHLPNITFVTEPTEVGGELFLPHAKDPEKEWGWKKLSKNINQYHTLNLHQTLIGSKVPNGFTLEKGISFDLFKGFNGDIYSGDIHMPQIVKGVEFVGSPYPVYFGDNYQGRVLLLDGEKKKELEYDCLSKWSIKIASPEELEDYEFEEGDQAKITLEMHPSDFPNWPDFKKRVKKFCSEEGVSLFALEMIPQKSVKRQSRRKRVSKSVKVESQEHILKRFVEKEKLSSRIHKAAEGIMDIDVGI